MQVATVQFEGIPPKKRVTEPTKVTREEPLNASQGFYGVPYNPYSDSMYQGSSYMYPPVVA